MIKDAAQKLASIQDPRALPLLIERLLTYCPTEAEKTVEAAICSFGEVGEKALFNLFRNSLQPLHIKRVELSMKLLRRLRSARMPSVIVFALEHPDTKVQLLGLESASEYRDQAVFEAIAKLLKGDAVVGMKAAAVLAEFGERAVPYFCAAIKDRDVGASVKADALGYLGRFPGAEYVSPMATAYGSLT